MGGVRYDPGGGGALPTTSFADAFIGGGRSMAGPRYYSQFENPNGTAGVDVDAQLNFSGAGGIFGSGSGVNNNAMRATFFPSETDPNAVRAGSLTRGSFAQWTLVSRTVGIDCEAGLVVFAQSGGTVGAAGYWLNVQSESTNTGLVMGLGTATYTVRANCFANAPGDVIRMEARWSLASNDLRTFQNGVLRSTDIDVNASRPQGGLNAFGFYGVFTGVLVMKDFSCGLL